MADIVVIGAGVIGLSAAYYLVADGHHVTVIDRDPAGDKASFGNAGGIGISEILPASAPGLIWRVPGWLVRSARPAVDLKLAHLPRLLPWLWRFLRSATAAETARITAALAALLAAVYDDLLPILETNSGCPATCTASARSGSTTPSGASSGMRASVGAEAPTSASMSRRSASPRRVGWSQR